MSFGWLVPTKMAGGSSASWEYGVSFGFRLDLQKWLAMLLEVSWSQHKQGYQLQTCATCWYALPWSMWERYVSNLGEPSPNMWVCFGHFEWVSQANPRKEKTLSDYSRCPFEAPTHSVCLFISSMFFCCPLKPLKPPNKGVLFLAQLFPSKQPVSLFGRGPRGLR